MIVVVSRMPTPLIASTQDCERELAAFKIFCGRQAARDLARLTVTAAVFVVWSADYFLVPRHDLFSLTIVAVATVARDNFCTLMMRAA